MAGILVPFLIAGQIGGPTAGRVPSIPSAAANLFANRSISTLTQPDARPALAFAGKMALAETATGTQPDTTKEKHVPPALKVTEEPNGSLKATPVEVSEETKTDTSKVITIDGRATGVTKVISAAELNGQEALYPDPELTIFTRVLEKQLPEIIIEDLTNPSEARSKPDTAHITWGDIRETQLPETCWTTDLVLREIGDFGSPYVGAYPEGNNLVLTRDGERYAFVDIGDLVRAYPDHDLRVYANFDGIMGWGSLTELPVFESAAVKLLVVPVKLPLELGKKAVVEPGTKAVQVTWFVFAKGKEAVSVYNAQVAGGPSTPSER